MRDSFGSLDPDALRYAEHWEPVLRDAALRLLEWVAATVGLDEAGAGGGEPGGAAPVILDAGAGTGTLSLAAAARWPAARLVGLDASAGMLSVARRAAHEVEAADRADAGRRAGAAERFRWLAADAARIPLDDASVDVVVSSFMLQLVDDRPAVLEEIHRVLRPGGVMGFVTWVADDLQLAPDVEFDEAVYDLELEDPDGGSQEPRQGDYASLEEARGELEAAGFRDVEVVEDSLSYRWTRDGYRRFKEDYDERELCQSLSVTDRERLMARVDERWAALPDGAFRLDARLVAAVARRADREG